MGRGKAFKREAEMHEWRWQHVFCMLLASDWLRNSDSDLSYLGFIVWIIFFIGLLFALLSITNTSVKPCTGIDMMNVRKQETDSPHHLLPLLPHHTVKPKQTQTSHLCKIWIADYSLKIKCCLSLTSSSSSSIASPVKYSTALGTIRSRMKCPISKSAANTASESSSWTQTNHQILPSKTQLSEHSKGVWMEKQRITFFDLLGKLAKANKANNLQNRRIFKFQANHLSFTGLVPTWIST